MVSFNGIGLVAACVTWSGFIMWTLYRLGSRKVQDDRTLRIGVNGFGIITWAVCIAVPSELIVESYPHKSLLNVVCLFAFIMLPICLWGGYFWGKGMSALNPSGRKK
jgi:hypothetical protein